LPSASAAWATGAREPVSITARRTSATGSSAGHSLDHQSFERALAQLADDEPQQELLLGPGGAGEERAQQTQAFGRRAGTALAHDLAQRVIDLGQSEQRRRRSRLAHRLAQCRIADADPALARLAGEIGDGDLDLRRSGATQAIGEMPDLRKPTGGLGDAVGSLDEIVEQHDQDYRVS
jgi:hypothetical protein